MKQLALVLLVACNTPTPAPLPPQRIADDAPALDALRSADFDHAIALASAQLAIEPRDSEAAAIRALASYVRATSHLFVATDMSRHSWFWFEPFFDPKNQSALNTFTEQLAAIDKDLAIADQDPRFSLELCLACWKYDWNHDGKVDERDTQLFQIDRDAKGQVIADGDPRRMPTFRFDLGDVTWARAMISFQRAAGELLQSYRWSDVTERKHDEKLVIHLIAPERVKHARELILAGLEFSEREREQYLAETDDDREWVPNPRQKNHPMPMPIDDKLYASWAGILEDVRHLVAGDQGVSIRELAGLSSPRLFLIAPDAYVDIGRMLAEPSDIVVGNINDESAKNLDVALHGILGHGYRDHMTPSPLIRRVGAMAKDLEDGTDTLDRKLRYMMWIN